MEVHRPVHKLVVKQAPRGEVVLGSLLWHAEVKGSNPLAHPLIAYGFFVKSLGFGVANGLGKPGM